MAVLLSAATQNAAEDKFIYKCISLGNTSAQLYLNIICVKVLQKILQRQENDWSRTDLQQGFRTEWVIRVLTDGSQFGTNRLIEFYVADTLMDDWEYRLLSAFHQDIVVCSFYTSKPELRLSFTPVCDYVFIMQDLQTKPDGLGNIFTLVEGLKKVVPNLFSYLSLKAESWSKEHILAETHRLNQS